MTGQNKGRSVLRQQAKRSEQRDGIQLDVPLGKRLSDEARFFKAWFENPLITGAVSPSGRFLARMMARYVDPSVEGPIIELGPGTGPVTQALLNKGIAPERLILVEFDPAFCDLLAKRFPRCRIVQGDAYDLARSLAGVLDEPAAAVVSSLPLLNKPDAVRLALLKEAFQLMRPEGCFIQFTYGMISPIPRRSKGRATPFFAAEPSPAVWLNLPPARVWIYRPAPSHAPVRNRKPGALIVKLREQTDKVRDELKERRDRVEMEIRLRTAKARREFELQTLRVRNERAFKPALALLRKIGEPRKPRG
jgi:phosphatidylethanolamine/phosphatidyl-N-methylethanolamine N-methyltransferase